MADATAKVATDLMTAEGQPPKGLSDADIALIKAKEAAAHNAEYAKYKTNESGFLVVPNDWSPPDGFHGNVLKNGMEISYPGYMINRHTDSLSDFGVSKPLPPKGK